MKEADVRAGWLLVRYCCTHHAFRAHAPKWSLNYYWCGLPLINVKCETSHTVPIRIAPNPAECLCGFLVPNNIHSAAPLHSDYQDLILQSTFLKNELRVIVRQMGLV